MHHPLWKFVCSRCASVLGLLTSGLLGLASRSGRLSPWLAKYSGDALWACAMFWLLRSIVGPRPRRRNVALATLLISWSVEFAQITPVPRALSAKHWLLRVMFGETFSGWDLPAYVVGVVVAVTVDTWLVRPPRETEA